MLHNENIQLFNELKQKKFIIITGSSGGGKTTFIKNLVDNFPASLLLIKHTTRKKRLGEQDNIDYYFLNSIEDFNNILNIENIIVNTYRYNAYYCLTLKEVQKAIIAKKIPTFILDVNAALLFQKIYTNTIIIFIAPQDINELIPRIMSRNTNLIDINNRIELIDEENDLIYKCNLVIKGNYCINSIINEITLLLNK